MRNRTFRSQHSSDYAIANRCYAGYGHYPERVLADPIYGTRANRDYLKQHGIRFAGKPLGRPKRETETNREQLKHDKEQRRQEYLQRIPIEGKFGQGKNGYRLNYIRAKRANTSFAWINTIFLVMNLLVLQRIFFARGQCRLVGLLQMIVRAWEQKTWNLRPYSNLAGPICSPLPRLIY